MSYNPYSKKTVNRIIYNYNPATSNSYEVFGENYKEVSVGVGNVKAIHEHYAAGEGDKWFYDVEFEDGNIMRIFNPHQVFFTIDETN